MISRTDETIPDTVWWESPYSEFEDFIGIGEKRVAELAAYLRDRGDRFTVNRLLAANGMEHGPCNAIEVAR